MLLGRRDSWFLCKEQGQAQQTTLMRDQTILKPPFSLTRPFLFLLNPCQRPFSFGHFHLIFSLVLI